MDDITEYATLYYFCTVSSHTIFMNAQIPNVIWSRDFSNFFYPVLLFYKFPSTDAYYLNQQQ